MLEPDHYGPHVRYVDVAVPVRVDSSYSYRVPAHLADRVGIGTRVNVVFGRRRLQGWVVGTRSEVPTAVADKIKDIESVIDDQLTASTQNSAPEGEVSLVGAGPGDPGLLTLRALRVMQNADVVVYDRLVSAEVMELVRRDSERIYVGKEAGKACVAQQDISQLLVDLAKQGKRVCRLQGGDPFVFGRGGEELELLVQHGVRFEVVPGITAAAGCAAYAGIPLTHRDHAQLLTFATGHIKHSDASGEAASMLPMDWDALTREHQTAVFYMGLNGLADIVRELQAHGAPASRAAAVIEQGTRANQRVIVATLATLVDAVRDAKVQSPALLIVGEVTRLHEELRWFNTTTTQALADVTHIDSEMK